jgi:hypothetical protein
MVGGACTGAGGEEAASPRLKTCSNTDLSVFFETAERVAGAVGSFFAAITVVPFLFFLRERGVEGGDLAAVEVQGCAFEKGCVARHEDVFHGGVCDLCKSTQCMGPMKRETYQVSRTWLAAIVGRRHGVSRGRRCPSCLLSGRSPGEHLG